MKKPSKEQIKFKQAFYNLMFELDLYNKFCKTFLLKMLNETEYGYYAHLYLVPGLSFEMLLEKKKILEQNLRCLWIMNPEPFKEYAEVSIVTKPIDVDLEYQPIELQPYEMYLGLDFSRKVVKINCNDRCMFLFSGATGTGKTRFLYMMLLSWIVSCSPDDVWLFLSDIAKDEYIIFRTVKHVKYYASDIEELFEMAQILNAEFQKRKKLISKFRNEGIATNIAEYNIINPHKKLPYCYILIDECSSIMPDKTDNRDDKSKKEYIVDTIKSIEKKGRALGMFCIIATQKTTRDEIPPIIKNMSAVRLSFRANDLVSSEVIMGNNAAVGLPDRIAVYSLNGGATQDYLFSPKLTIEALNEFLKPYKASTKSKSRIHKKIEVQSAKVIPIPKHMDYKDFLRQYKQPKDNFLKVVYGEGNYNDY